MSKKETSILNRYQGFGRRELLRGGGTLRFVFTYILWIQLQQACNGMEGGRLPRLHASARLPRVFSTGETLDGFVLERQQVVQRRNLITLWSYEFVSLIVSRVRMFADLLFKYIDHFFEVLSDNVSLHHIRNGVHLFVLVREFYVDAGVMIR